MLSRRHGVAYLDLRAASWTMFFVMEWCCEGQTYLSALEIFLEGSSTMEARAYTFICSYSPMQSPQEALID